MKIVEYQVYGNVHNHLSISNVSKEIKLIGVFRNNWDDSDSEGILT